MRFDYILPLEAQLEVVLRSALLGVCIGLIYDGLRALRRFFAAGKIGTLLLDGLFWIIVLVCLFLFGIGASAGQTRLYVLLSILLGGVLYTWLLSKTILSIFLYLLAWGYTVFAWVCKAFAWLSDRAKWLFGILRNAFDKILAKIKQIWARHQEQKKKKHR